MQEKDRVGEKVHVNEKDLSHRLFISIQDLFAGEEIQTILQMDTCVRSSGE